MPFKPDTAQTEVPPANIFKPSRFAVEPSPIDKLQALTEKPSLSRRVDTSIQKRGEDVYSAITDSTKSPITRGFQATASAFGGIGDVLTETAKSIPIVKDIYGAVEGGIKKGSSALIDRLSKTPLFMEASQNPEGTKKLEEVLSILSSSGEISGNILAAEGVKTGVQKAVDASPKLVSKLTTQSEDSIRNALVKSFEKGIKPGLFGKKTLSKLEDYRDDVVDAVKTIKANKQNLNFADDASDDVIESISGQTPKTLQQLAESIEQTKRKVFTEYDTMAKTAGEAGAKVKPSSIADELETVVNSKALRLSNPEAIRFAQDWQERLRGIDELSTVDAQEVVQNLNKSLEAFYRNPSYDAASKAAIEALVANKLRTSLDDVITSLQGEGYNTLRKQYGSLKAIENDVLRATLRQSRANVKGLIDYTDIFSGGQVVSGLLTLNPQLIATGAAQKAIASFFKYLNSPNRAIQDVFKLADKLPD